VTSLVVQDGGLAGSVSNLVILAVVGVVAAVSLLVAVVLLLTGDIHGGAASVGAVLGVGLLDRAAHGGRRAGRDRRRRRRAGR
jgi:hypothetical protein